MTECPDGTYFADGSCLACSSRCLTCQGNTDKCTSCQPNQFFFDGNCFSECPVAIVEGVCTDVCPDGFFFTNK